MDMIEPTPGLYRHFKGGKYRVLGVAAHSESGEELVVYRSVDDDAGMWVRPRSMFVSNVSIDGEAVPRFERLVDSLTQPS